MDLSIIILAAGKGTRMKTKTPKVMHKLAGRALIEHVISLGTQLSPKEIKVVVNEDLIKDTAFIELEKKYHFKTCIQKEQKGTAHALQCAELEKISSKHILVLYGDTPLITKHTLEKMLASKSAFATIFGFITPNNQGYGRLIVEQDHTLLDIVEEKDASLAMKAINLCNSGVMLLETDPCRKLLNKITNHNPAGEYYLTDIIRIANKEGYRSTYIESPEDEARGVNDMHQLSELEAIFQEKMRKLMMESGVYLIAPSTVFFSADTVIAPGVVIHPNVVFGIGVSVAADSEIFSFSHLEGSTIGKNCKIGPFARLRTGSLLEGDNKIGNFVELKNATLSYGSKSSHLAYIGDATLGKNCNIGAGSIFCNYDGQQKHTSHLGNNVFVGSNSSIVSPVEIGDNALIGAGSVITKNIAENELSIARAQQVNLKDKRKLK